MDLVKWDCTLCDASAIVHKLEQRVVKERDISLDELLHADEMFVANALLGIMPVAGVGTAVCDLRVNPIASRLCSAQL